MNLRRVVTNAAVLFSFCGVFYLITAGINWLASNEPTNTPKEFSFHRIQSDQLMRGRNWKKAATHLEQLVQEDPYDGNAWYFLATCYGSMRRNYLVEIYNEERSENPDPERLTELKQKAAEISELAIPAYERSVDFARFRNKSRFALARIYSFQGDKEQAIEYLTAAMNDKFTSGVRGGIRGVYEFKTIANEPAFQDLIRRERRNRGR